MKIALVLDGIACSVPLRHALGRNAAVVDLAADCAELEDLLATYAYDAVIIGSGRAGDAGCTVRGLRGRESLVPLLVVGAERASERIASLRAGADDVVSAGVPVDEIIARLHALVRRCSRYARSSIDLGNVAVDIDASLASVDARPLGLTAKEFGLLRLFALRVGVVLSRQQVINALYNSEAEPDERIVDVYLCTLRRKLRIAGALIDIETIRGLGYVLRAQKDGARVPAPQRPRLTHGHAALCPAM